MNSKKNYRFGTKVIHCAQSPDQWGGSTLPPIYQSASQRYPTAEKLSDAFTGKTNDHIYMRLSNPTNRVLEEKLIALEGGQGAIVMSSGMAAISNTCLALLRSGDEFVSGNSLFMSTYLLFVNVFSKYEITAKLVESTDMTALEKAVNKKTRFIYLETIGNPKMDVPDLARAKEIAAAHEIPLIVDNTMATPYLCRPIELGADVVIHSTTKYLSGHGAATGGAVVDSGRFEWPKKRFPDLQPFVEKKGNLALLDKIWREHHINFGTTQAPFHSYLTMIGLDTLAVRMERHMANAITVATYLAGRPEVEWVNYPGLEGHASYQTALQQFGDRGFGGMLTFDLAGREQCTRFINHLRLIYHLANLGDCKTLAIHPYSTQYAAFEESIRKRLSISPGMIRLSVGIEDVEDICEDLRQALERI